jgi:hypothetical protein
VRARAEAILAQTEKAASPHRIVTSLFAGMRFDSNPAAAPGTGSVLLNDQLVALNPRNRAAADGSGVANLSTRYTYDLGFQDASRLEVNALGSLQRFISSDEFSTGVLAADIGPWLGLGGALGSTEIRPYLTGTYLNLADRTYLRQGGGGLTARTVLAPNLEVLTGVQVVNQAFSDSPRRPFASLQTGTAYLITSGVAYRFMPGHVLGAEIGVSIKDARAVFWQSTGFSAGVSYGVEYAAPFGLTDRPWATSVTAVARDFQYAGPDPQISARTRHDSRGEFGVTQVIGLTGNASVVVRGEYLINDSNLRNWAYDNIGFSAGVQVVF